MGRQAAKWLCVIGLAFLCASAVQVLALRFANPPFTAPMAWESLRELDSGGLSGLRGRWRPLEKISPYLRKAVLAGEDQRFLSHHGFDFIELSQAARELALGEGQRGASTITMQVARTVFLWPDRTWLRKIAEAYYTVLIEIFWTKERILEVYLNTVDWGDDVRGAGAAARKYFHSTPERLTRYQAALLAAVLPSPHRWSPAKPNSYVSMRQKKILEDMAFMPLLPQ